MRRFVVALCVWGGVVLLGSACSGPTAEQAPSPQTPSAYQVQLRMTERKAAAERALGTALEWWERSAASLPSPQSTDGSPVRIEWRAPLYRVRLGPFASREDADAVLEAAREAFPDAFVVPARSP